MDPAWLPGFVYRPELLGEDEETRLVAGVRGLAFGEVRMRGVVARRRTAHFGWLYGYESWRIEPGPPLPPFLLPLRERVAALAGVDAGRFVEILVSEYTAGAGIGWHRDAPMFGVVVGVSLLGACRLRFRRSIESPRGTRAGALAPRSAYVLDGEARSGWQHSIPPARTLRYSVTFRTLRRHRAAGDERAERA
jgi:DNA oxidative demethylase